MPAGFGYTTTEGHWAPGDSDEETYASDHLERMALAADAQTAADRAALAGHESRLDAMDVIDANYGIFTVTAKSIANAAEAALGTTSPDRAYTETADPLAWHDPATNPERISPKTAGRYRVTISAEFATNSTGIRLIRARKNATAGGAITSGWVLPLLTPASVADGSVSFEGDFNGTTDYLTVSAYQNSGGALNLTSCVVSVERIR